jgi:hypothetical protein
MGLLNALRKIDRKRWFVCSTCMTESGHDELKSVFYSEGPRVLVLGRPWMKCPRCGGTNTRSFQEIKDDGSEAAAWGLERFVKKYPRSQFQVPSAEAKSRH